MRLLLHEIWRIVWKSGRRRRRWSRLGPQRQNQKPQEDTLPEEKIIQITYQVEKGVYGEHEPSGKEKKQITTKEKGLKDLGSRSRAFETQSHYNYYWLSAKIDTENPILATDMDFKDIKSYRIVV